MNWYVMQTRPQEEFALDLYMRRPGVMSNLSIEEVYCPVETYETARKGKKVIDVRTLIPGYLFVRCMHPRVVVEELFTRGMTKVLQISTDDDREVPAVICDAVIREIREIEYEIAHPQRFGRKGYRRSANRFRCDFNVGEMVSIPHLGVNMPNRPVKEVRDERIRLAIPLFGAERDVWVRRDQVVPA